LLKDLRSALLCILSFTGFFRISALLSIRVGDLMFTESSTRLTITVRKSKTDQFGSGSHVYIAATGNLTCPISLLRWYLASSGVANTPSMYLFRNIEYCSATAQYMLSSRNVSLSYTRAREIFRECMTKIGAVTHKYTLHMLRRGSATAAARAGVPSRALLRQGRWRCEKSSAPYIKADEELQFNITKAVGL